MQDSFGRTIDYLRLSLTERCNLRCIYCMPHEGVEWKKRDALLSFEDMERLCRIFADVGIKKIKITGGEPLIKKDIMLFLRRIKKINGIENITLTTNGTHLENYIDDLLSIGIKDINISLDSLNKKTFEKIAGVNEFDKTFSGIKTALQKGMNIKINTVIIKGINDNEINDFLFFALDNPVALRFIELMPLGTASSYAPYPTPLILEKLKALFLDVESVNEKMGNGPAVYYKAPAMRGSIGFISAISHSFCASCNRLRLDSAGNLKPCLSSDIKVNLKALLESGAADGEIKNAILEIVEKKPRAHIFLEKEKDILMTQDMYKIGG